MATKFYAPKYTLKNCLKCIDNNDSTFNHLYVRKMAHAPTTRSVTTD